MVRRSVVTGILLTIVTCGLYSFYWMACVNDDVNTIDNERYGTSGLTAVILTLITCHLYFIYWSYATGSKIDRLKADYGYNSNLAIICCLCSLFGMDIIALAILQNEINSFELEV